MFLKLKTWAQLEAATDEERRQWADECLAWSELAFGRQLSNDATADMRALRRGHGDIDPGISKPGGYAKSGTTRSSDYD